MNDEIDDIKKMWDAGKKSTSMAESNPDQIILMAKKNKRDTISQHIGTIAILTITLIGISCFFIYVAPVKQVISLIGVGLMTGSLVIRIIIEIYSLLISQKLDLTESALKNSDATIDFHKFRKQIHGPTMITILIFYTLGFYLLTPEFSLYLSSKIMVLVHLSYLVGAVIVGLSIRNSIKKEMLSLNEILRLKNKLME